MVRADLDLTRGCVEGRIEYEGSAVCPACGCPSPKYDHRERRWRHLDLFQYAFYVTAEIPRVNCKDHGVVQLPVPWAEGKSGFTALFERIAISLIQEMSLVAVARHLRISWDEIDGIMERAVKRGLHRRTGRAYRFIGIDEKSIKKRHKYFTVVSDLEAGNVIWIGRGRKREALDAFWRTLSLEQREGIEGIAMDMWLPFYESTLLHVPGAKQKIVFDKFHIIKHLVDAVDLTRKQMLRDLGRDEAASLKGTKYDWLRNPRNMDHSDKIALAKLRTEYEKLGRAWTIKELFSQLWDYQRESAARTFFDDWYGWAVRSRLPAIVSVAKMIKRHFENIITYLRLRITNAAAEGLNSKIQWIKYQARGFRNEDRFERAILFHCGGLDLLPTHSNS